MTTRHRVALSTTIKRRLGFKDRVITHCRPGEHIWRIAYGDERLHHGKWHCRNCPSTKGPRSP